MMLPSADQKKKALHSILASRLSNLKIPSCSTSSPADSDLDFSELFGPVASSPSPSALFLGDPQVIHNRSHSFVGPSPRFTLSKSLPFQEELVSESDDEDENEVVEVSASPRDKEVEEVDVGLGVKNIAEVKKIGPGDFEILRVIGKGGFGKVFQVRKLGLNGMLNDGDGIFAMKVMRKDTIIKNNHVDYMKAERDILTKVVHPFIVQLRYSFQTKSKLYLILDFINGGHLFYHLYRQGIFSEDQAMVYTAEIVSAVSHLHKCGIVHRDLKPENILMDSDGHVMLTDFGLAKEIDESSRSNSMCGTTEYMAPEILLRKGHNKEADWWSVGILLFEMLTGKPPYFHSNRKKLQEKIISERLKLPPRLSGEAHSLLKGLLNKDPSKRLGSGPKGGDEIKAHKWFRSINWKKLEARELQPKFKPDVTGTDCTANFDKCWTTMPPDDSPAATPTSGEFFQGYTYVAPNPWLSSSQ
ncbi:OLC1v1012916C3 [Oldenlandia corymbosa var. corymbosa]|uniref:non-specific serine/threonine protein kinase n=1 Tax=Oldenlandia corymbosa var. corymbosa TaxID=529605 RepID=A0AAV1DWZ3_OLDCO|nr:OLC1v1012916C3 [Oldenlandia corymbosa var. corymbosa]